MALRLARYLAPALLSLTVVSGLAETLHVTRAASPGTFGTLGEALRAYAGRQHCPPEGVRIEIAPDTYEDERLALEKVPCPLTIAGRRAAADAPHGDGRPIFRGRSEGTWLVVRAPGAGHIDLAIQRLEITDYQTAISVNGNRSSIAGWVGGLQIVNNRFARIGSPRPDQSPSTAAIRLVNSRNNLIIGNEFESVRNARSCGGLHAVYMAHMSSHNLIRSNSFVDGCGDVIKVRDQSNDNRIEQNTFERQEGHALLLDSFCDKLSRTDCTKAGGECPSWNNVFEGNTIRGPRSLSNRKDTVARRIVSDLTGICPPPPPGMVRILEVGDRR